MSKIVLFHNRIQNLKYCSFFKYFFLFIHIINNKFSIALIIVNITFPYLPKVSFKSVALVELGNPLIQSTHWLVFPV